MKWLPPTLVIPALCRDEAFCLPAQRAWSRHKAGMTQFALRNA